MARQSKALSAETSAMRSIDVALQGVAKLPPKVRGRVLRYAADQVADRLNELAAGGVTELVFQPCGPDIRRELETFMETARAAVPA